MKIIEIQDTSTIQAITAEQAFPQFLQSWGWKSFQEAYGRKTMLLGAQKDHELLAFALIIIHALPFGKCFFYCPRGPVFAAHLTQPERGEVYRLFWEYCNAQRQAQDIFLRIEPPERAENRIWFENDLTRNAPMGWKHASFVQPQDTWILDLRKNDETLLAGMHPKTRYNIGLAQRKGVCVRAAGKKGAASFLATLQKTARHQDIQLHNLKHYQLLLEMSGITELPSEMPRDDMSNNIYEATFQGKTVASYLMIFYKNTATYLHGGTDYAFRQLMAPQLLQWFTILEAKKMGYHYYDFFGIAPHSAESRHPLWELSRYKRGFGGFEMNYVGAYEIIFEKYWHQLYCFTKKISRLKRLSFHSCL